MEKENHNNCHLFLGQSTFLSKNPIIRSYFANERRLSHYEGNYMRSTIAWGTAEAFRCSRNGGNRSLICSTFISM